MPDVDINHVAHLARIELTDAEKVKFSAQLKDMLAYVDQLSRVDVTGVEPTAHAIPLTNVLRKDEIRPSIATERILKNAPESARDLFIVPKIVE
ncbi:MAG: Glutamyl-tRNA(Gln) amidotransferase subunit C [Verrucomicrobiae bacterium]|nr:Glutamyl-tRNA(Gln) amidotransferase subunit C [Verrucomicrobiae bacterium]